MPPSWLTREALLGASGRRTAGEQRRAFAAYHEAPPWEGPRERVWHRVAADAVLLAHSVLPLLQPVPGPLAAASPMPLLLIGQKGFWRVKVEE